MISRHEEFDYDAAYRAFYQQENTANSLFMSKARAMSHTLDSALHQLQLASQALSTSIQHLRDDYHLSIEEFERGHPDLSHPGVNHITDQTRLILTTIVGWHEHLLDEEIEFISKWKIESVKFYNSLLQMSTEELVDAYLSAIKDTLFDLGVIERLNCLVNDNRKIEINRAAADNGSRKRRKMDSLSSSSFISSMGIIKLAANKQILDSTIELSIQDSWMHNELYVEGVKRGKVLKKLRWMFSI